MSEKRWEQFEQLLRELTDAVAEAERENEARSLEYFRSKLEAACQALYEEGYLHGMRAQRLYKITDEKVRELLELAKEWMDEFDHISASHFGDPRAESVANVYRSCAKRLLRLIGVC